MIRRIAPVLLCGAIILALAAPALADKEPNKPAKKPAAGGMPHPKWAKIKEIRDKIQLVAMSLQKIQQEVVKSRPDLVKKQKALRARVAARMKKLGVNEEKAMAELMAMREKLANPDIPEETKKKMAEKMKQKAIKLKAAHDRATSDPKVKKIQAAFRKAMEAAMIKADPKSRKLLEDFYKLRKQLRDLIPAQP